MDGQCDKYNIELQNLNINNTYKKSA